MYHLLSNSKIEHSERYERHFKYIKDMWIPLADEETQDKIIQECDAVDEKLEKAREQITKTREHIKYILSRVNGETKSLRVIAPLVTERVNFDMISACNYVTTDNMLQNFGGIRQYDGEPQTGNVTEYKCGDILMSNIRPYLKKIWLADRDGGCNPDVMVFRPTSEVLPKFVYYMLSRQEFIDYVMNDIKGMKMPRGNKDNTIRYTIPVPLLKKQQQIVEEISTLEAKIAAAKVVINRSANYKQAILDKYLK